ncbi:MAG: gliding motility-associated C-terminal domain-containing protein [Bacteroidota bacterium]
MIGILFRKIVLTAWFFFTIIHFSFAQNIPFECDHNAYFSHHESGGDLLYKFTPDFNFTLLKQLDFSINGIAFNPTDNFMYALNESTTHIVRVDQNGDHIDLGLPVGIPGSNYWAGTFTKDGRMIISGGSNAWIVVLDVTTVPPTVLAANAKYYADGSSGNPSFGDIAVDPSSGVCYTFENGTRRLATIDISTGAVQPFGETFSKDSDSNGAFYFNKHGTPTGFFLKDIYQFDKVTGESVYVGDGLDVDNGIDACGCLNPIQFDKIAEPAEVCAGDTVTFTFEITNASNTTFTNIQFADPLSGKFTLVSPPSSTLGGFVETIPLADGYNLLVINEMEIPVGTSSFSFDVAVASDSDGITTVFNQARLGGFDPSWENFVDSNNPFTIQGGDATSVLVSATPLLSMDLETIGTGCEDTSFELIADASISGNFTWELPDGSFFEGQSYNQSRASILDQGNYNIQFTDVIGCQIDSFLTFDVFPAPSIDLGNDSTFCFENSFTIAPGNYFSYVWQDGSSGADFLIENYGRYAVEVTNEHGCSALDSIIFSSGCPADLYVPNAFSPNDDGRNDFFRAYGVEVVNFNLKIFDRWGALLFETQDIETGWDGFFNGKRKASGVYVWMIEASFLNGQTIRNSGDLTLHR